MNKLRGLLFDVGGVLLTIDYPVLAEQAKEMAGPSAPVPEAFERAEWRSRVVLDEHLRKKSTETSDTRRRYLHHIWEFAWREAGTEPPPSVSFDAWARAIEETHRRVNIWRRRPPDALEAVERMASADLVLGVVSNADGRVASLLETAGLARHFPHILDSAIEGVEKPDPEIFNRALDRLGLTANETIFVGDFYSVDVVGARRAGLGAILMDPGGFWNKADVPRVHSLTDCANRIFEVVETEPSPWKTS